MSPILFGLYFLLGCFASLLSGLLGVGGGLIIVPTLIYLYSTYHIVFPEQVMHLTIGTSLACSVVNLISSVRVHHKKQAIRWPLFKTMSLGVVLGALLLGPSIVHVVSSNFLKILFGLFCICSAINMGIRKKNNPLQQEMIPSKIVLFFWGLMTGGISTILGIAGGVFTGSFFHYCKINMREIIGTTAAICLLLSVSGSTGLMLVGFHQPNLPLYSTGYIYWPAFIMISLPSFWMAPIGASLAHRLPVSILRKLFACLILVVGIKILM
jgi:uncharacterized membrane protein YfcA